MTAAHAEAEHLVRVAEHSRVSRLIVAARHRAMDAEQALSVAEVDSKRALTRTDKAQSRVVVAKQKHVQARSGAARAVTSVAEAQGVVAGDSRLMPACLT